MSDAVSAQLRQRLAAMQARAEKAEAEVERLRGLSLDDAAVERAAIVAWDETNALRGGYEPEWCFLSQTDRDTNRRIIRACLRAALDKINREPRGETETE